MRLSLDTLFKCIKEALYLIDTSVYFRVSSRVRYPKMGLEKLLGLIVYFGYVGATSFKRYVEDFIFEKYKIKELSYNRLCYWRKSLHGLLEEIAHVLCDVPTFKGTALIDSTAIAACAIQRERQHKVHSKYASKSKGSLGWFYGFKLHIITSEVGRLLRFSVTSADSHDVTQIKDPSRTTGLSGTLIGDSAYQSNPTMKILKAQDLNLIVKPLKSKLKKMPWDSFKAWLYEMAGIRWRIESVFNTLKSNCSLSKAKNTRSTGALLSIVYSSLILYEIMFNIP